MMVRETVMVRRYLITVFWFSRNEKKSVWEQLRAVDPVCALVAASPLIGLSEHIGEPAAPRAPASDRLRCDGVRASPVSFDVYPRHARCARINNVPLRRCVSDTPNVPAV